MAALIAYLRVSTVRQGESGLGLASQQSIVEGFARQNGAKLEATYVEVESGKQSDRPQLARALARCKASGATLVVARLDRLARDLHFVATMLKDGVEFVACDAPYANRLTLGILAAVAEDEGRRISERTKAALAAAKARGVRLGGLRTAEMPRATIEAGCAAVRSQAQQRAHALSGVVASLRAQGNRSAAAIADGLNALSVATPRNGRWHAASAARLLHRLDGTTA